MKVVSLLPAATESVCALGLRDALVGRSHACDYPEQVRELPVLTRPRIDLSLPSAELDAQVRRIVAQRLPLYMLDEARLAALAPDVVVTQEACAVCAISYEQVVGSLKRTAPAARIVSLLPARLGDVLEDARAVASACGVAARGETLVAALRERLARTAAGAAPGARPRVAVVEWLDPPMLAGHWVPDAIEAAGGVSLGPPAGAPSPATSWEEVRALRADAVVVAPCGFDLRRTRAEAEPRLPQLRSLAPRVLLLDGNAYLNRPGPRLVDAVEILASWLRGSPVQAGRGLALEPAVVA